MDWRPDITGGEGFIHQRIVRALEADIAVGALTPDTRLPTHRDLAHRLGVGVGAVTQAYAQAEARGLIASRVGRGSFVAGPQSRGSPEAIQPGIIDLARNTAPSLAAATHLATTLTALRRRNDLAVHLGYPPPAGMESHRRAGAAWLGATVEWPDVDADRIICTGGAQQAIAVAMAAACRPGDAVIVEEATFSGLKTLADHMGYLLKPVAMDRHGILPDAMDRMADATSARVAYLQPLQNPTGRIMDLERRHAILAVARRRGMMIVEDDLYGAYAADLALPPLAVLAPDRVFYVSGLSKSLTPGLRVGYLVPPLGGDRFARCLTALRAVAFGPPGLAGLIAAQWIEDGTAHTVLGAHKTEFAARSDLARGILAGAEAPRNQTATHLWVPMSELAAERAAARALTRGVEVTPAAAPQIAGSDTHGLRVCLGAAPNRAVLVQGLTALARAMIDGADDGLGMV